MLYDILKFIFVRIFSVLFRCEVSGQEHIPKEGSVIIAANHRSNWDPALAAAFMPRDVHFMAKDELFKIPVFGYFITQLHAFPVRRGASDRTAIRMAIKLLSDGNCLGLFPEGTRSKDGLLGKPEAGLALIALKAGAMVVPTALIGTDKIFRNGSMFPKLEIRYGIPMQLDKTQTDKVALQEFSQKVMTEIEKLMITEKDV